MDKSLLFISKLWLLLCYFFGFKQRFSIVFYPQIDNLQAFDNFAQNDLAKLMLIAKFVYNNGKNISINYLFFELNCGYYPCIQVQNSRWVINKTRKIYDCLPKKSPLCSKALKISL